MQDTLETLIQGSQGVFQAVFTPNTFAMAERAIQKAQSRLSIPPRHDSPAWETDEAGSSSASSSSDSDSASSSSDDDQQRKGKKRRKGKGNKKKKKRQRRSARLVDDDKKVVLRICCRDFEIYAHSKPKKKFWQHVQEELKKETNKDLATVDKAVLCWEKHRRRILALIKEGKFSGEEEDNKEFLIALDEWISLVDSLKAKQKAREERIGRAEEETKSSQRAQENLGRRWANKERTPPPTEVGILVVLIDDQESLDRESINPFIDSLALASQASASSSSRAQTKATAKQIRQQPLPPQPLTDIAAGINSIVAELKAEREGAAQSIQVEELSRLDAEVKDLRESIEERLASSEEKTNLVLSILLRIEQQQKKEKKKEGGADT